MGIDQLKWSTQASSPLVTKQNIKNYRKRYPYEKILTLPNNFEFEDIEAQIPEEATESLWTWTPLDYGLFGWRKLLGLKPLPSQAILFYATRTKTKGRYQ